MNQQTNKQKNNNKRLYCINYLYMDTAFNEDFTVQHACVHVLLAPVGAN